jgi:hypothetical protein
MRQFLPILNLLNFCLTLYAETHTPINELCCAKESVFEETFFVVHVSIHAPRLHLPGDGVINNPLKFY